MSWSPTLFSESGPVGLPPVPWTKKKKQFNDRQFSSDAKVIAVAKTWLDVQPSEFFFLSGLEKLEHSAKKFIELRGECGE